MSPAGSASAPLVPLLAMHGHKPVIPALHTTITVAATLCAHKHRLMFSSDSESWELSPPAGSSRALLHVQQHSLLPAFFSFVHADPSKKHCATYMVGCLHVGCSIRGRVGAGEHLVVQAPQGAGR